VFFVLKKPFPEHTGIQESKTELAHISKDTLVITGIKQQYGADFDLKIDTKYIGLASYDSASVMYINPRLSIEKSNTGRFEMQIIKSARHRTLRKAEKSVEEINYQYRVENDTLKLNTFFESQPSKFWQSKKLEIKLFVPEGKTVYVDETLQYNLIDSDNMPVEKRRQMINRFWTQDNKTLK
jgi:hypothetical protein